MRLFRHMGKLPLLVVASLMAMIVALAACGGGTATTASLPKAAATIPPTSTPEPATATVSALVKMIVQVGQPTAKMLSGATFEVNGQIKNGDNKQHDITLQVTLLDASGKQRRQSSSTMYPAGQLWPIPFKEQQHSRRGRVCR